MTGENRPSVVVGDEEIAEALAVGELDLGSILVRMADEFETPAAFFDHLSTSLAGAMHKTNRASLKSFLERTDALCVSSGAFFEFHEDMQQ